VSAEWFVDHHQRHVHLKSGSNYGELFTYVQNLVKLRTGAHHQIYVAGFR